MLAHLGFRLMRPLLENADAERAHAVTLAALKWLPVSTASLEDSVLASTQFGLQFPNPLGLAAGFDKNGEAMDQMLSLGFGFVEVGTTTPLPQAGNSKPRLFRLPQDQGVINRMGFNNAGHEAMHRALMNRSRGGIVGVNIGANKDSPDRFADYARGLTQFAANADYLTINISSPNTPGLRALQGKAELTRLLDLARETLAQISRRTPLLVKIAPDLDQNELEAVANACLGRADGVIISNTTTSRNALLSSRAGEAGGLSGRPLYDLSTQQLARFYLLTGGKIPLIGVGGICDTVSAWMKICAGASLIQLYTALVYAGPALVPGIVKGLAQHVRDTGMKHYSEAIGLHAQAIAQGRMTGIHHNGTGA